MKDHEQKLNDILALLSSKEFKCPADTLDESKSDRAEEIEPLSRPHGWIGDYDKGGHCTNMLTVHVEPEWGEMGTDLGSSLVISGDCDDIHDLNDDSRVNQEVSIRYAERQRLLKLAIEIASR